MGTSGGPGKIDALNYGDQLKGLADVWSRRGGRTFRQAFPMYQQLIGQTMEALRTGGVGAQIPIIQRAVEQSKMATAGTQRELGGRLAEVGLGGTPWGERLLSEARTTGNVATSRIPTEIASAFISGAPGLAQSGFGASGAFGGLGANVLSQLQSLDLQRQIFNNEQFKAFMQDLQKTAMQMGSAAGMACLHPDTPVDTPHGPEPIRRLFCGDLVLSQDADGAIVPARIVRRHIQPILSTHRFSVLADGALVSPTHPLPDGTPLGEATSTRLLAQSLDALETCDITVDSPTGTYRVAGVWLGSTLDRRHRRREVA